METQKQVKNINWNEPGLNLFLIPVWFLLATASQKAPRKTKIIEEIGESVYFSPIISYKY